MVISLNDIDYLWDGVRWVDAKTYLVPTVSIVNRLNDLLADKLAIEDNNIASIDELMKRARVARDALQLNRSIKLLNRILDLNPNNLAALAILCSVLRRQGSAEEALERTERHRSSGYNPLMTSRAAAYCDLSRWEEAKRQLSIGSRGYMHQEAYNVLRRIKAARPDLYGE